MKEDVRINDFIIAPLRTCDSHLVSTLIRYNLNDDIFPLTIFSSNKYELFLSKLLSIPSRLRKVQYFGAYQDNKLLGFTEWRILEDGIFLNQISLFPNYRGMGVGKALLEHGLTLLKDYKKTKMSLDVFEDNLYAEEWYRRKGFTSVTTTQWYLGNHVRNFDIEKSNQYSIENFNSSEAEQEIYRFSILNVKSPTKLYRVGRIKEHLYRINGIHTFLDEGLQSVLQELDNSRSLLVLTEKELKCNHFRFIAASKRMSLNLCK